MKGHLIPSAFIGPAFVAGIGPRVSFVSRALILADGWRLTLPLNPEGPEE